MATLLLIRMKQKMKCVFKKKRIRFVAMKLMLLAMCAHNKYTE